MTDEPPELEPADRDLADHLALARPVPPAGFRGRLGRRLADRDPGYGPRPERLRLTVAGYLGAGGLLIVLAALGFS
jgi:hypothetical protein